IRGLGYIDALADLDKAVVKVTDNVPIRIQDIAKVNFGPQPRNMSGILDKGGAEAVGGVVIARYGDNPLQVIEGIKKEIEKLSPGLPSKTLTDGTVSKLTLVPFYDRSGLIYETLGTLYEAINLQILVTILVILVMVANLRASLLISSLLPLAVLMCFIFMRYFGVDANIMALSGIAIAIGTLVDLGIILNENILRHLELAPKGQSKLKTIYEASAEVSGAILTAVGTTIISFLPVFTLEAAEGKLFGPLAYTKTFVLIAAVLITLFILPAFTLWVVSWRSLSKKISKYLNYGLLGLGPLIGFYLWAWAGLLLFSYGVIHSLVIHYPDKFEKYKARGLIGATLLGIAWLLTTLWMPLGVSVSTFSNFLFISSLLLGVLGGFIGFIQLYPKLLSWCLTHKRAFLLFPTGIILIGSMIWLGFGRVFGIVPITLDGIGLNIRTNPIWSGLTHSFPGLGKEFMPSLNEGSFLLMPSSMPHSGIQENKEVLQKLDMGVASIPEVEMVVGKAGRAETAIDPAPITMYENTINYKSEYATDTQGKRLRFKVKDGKYELKNGTFLDPKVDSLQKVKVDDLVPDASGEYFRQWRAHIRNPDDIWNEILKVVNLPGVTSSPKLQPIETRLVMLQTGMRAPMGIKVYGPDLETIESFGLKLENYLKEVPSVKKEAVFADRIVGKPYLELAIDREKISRYGLNVIDVQEFIETAIGGMKLSTTVEGRERFPIRVRYAREYRDNPAAIENLQIPTPTGNYIPLGQLVSIQYRPGPDMIRGENSFLVGFVLLDKMPGFSEVTVVEQAKSYLKEKIDTGELDVPEGVRFEFSGSYENQVRAEKRLSFIVPLCFLFIFLLLYFQFRAVSTTLFIFTGIAMTFSGGFLMLWLFGQEGFLNIELWGTNLRDLFQMKAYNLSVAVWVGFIALFGIATDDGVVVATYLDQSFARVKPSTVDEIRNTVMEAGKRRVLPCMMTTATTLLALVPIFTSTGKGSDVMIPMAIPALGGMLLEVITVFIVPTLYCWWAERKLRQSLTIDDHVLSN
ncbi:MAG: efflux RND transporter permease subunit, partial [Bacteroidetes bacterium]|nr:efflux RND transporter permease subunit [Bacteroidota bacterium]